MKIDPGTNDLVTDEYFKSHLDAVLNKLLIKLGMMTAAIVGIATSILGVLISVK